MGYKTLRVNRPVAGLPVLSDGFLTFLLHYFHVSEPGGADCEGDVDKVQERSGGVRSTGSGLQGTVRLLRSLVWAVALGRLQKRRFSIRPSWIS